MPQTIQRSFTAGELAPSLRSRADMNKYIAGLALCKNFLIRPQGGVYSRPGTRFIAELDDQSKRGRLLPFSFNTQQTYVLVFEHLKMRVIRAGGLVLVGGGPAIFELVTPYTDAQLPTLGFTQSADVMTIVHPSHDPANLSRIADDNWSLDIINYAPTVTPPTFIATVAATITNITQANPAVVAATNTFSENETVKITGVGGMIEVNDRFFTIINVTGATFELKDEDSTGHTAYTSGGTATRTPIGAFGDGAGDFDKEYTYVVTAVDGNGIESIASAQVSILTKSLSVTASVVLTWETVVGADFYRVYKDPSNNTDVFGFIGESRTLSFTDFNIAPLTTDSPPVDRQPFTGADNNPSTVTYYQQRQVFGNTNNEPQAVYTTQTADFNSLRTSSPARDDDAITFTINAREVNEVRHLVSLDSLIILTSGGEWKVTEGQDQVFTPATAGVKIQSYNGASTVPPVVINSTALYVQDKGNKVRDLSYEFTADKFTGNDLSLMSEHLFRDVEIEEMAYADEPYGILWCVLSDGRLLGLTYQREHQVWGWHQHNTAGEFESIAVITEDDRDAPYFIVKRTIDGVTKRYIERMEPRFTNDIQDSFFVDSGLSYDGVPVTTVTGLDHLEGESVAALVDGYEVTGLVVISGSVTFTRPISKAHIGLAYLPVIETLDIDTAGAGQTLKGAEVSVSKVIIEVEESRGGFVGAIDDLGTANDMLEIKPRFDSDSYDAITLKSFKSEIFIEPDWNKGGGLRIEQRSPLPLSILAIIPNVDIGGI